MVMNNKGKVLGAMSLFSVFLFATICRAAISLSYNTGENYVSSNYQVEVIPVSTSLDIFNAKGTHRFWIDQQLIRDLSGQARQHIIDNYCIPMAYLDGYYSRIINIYDKSNILLCSGYYIKSNKNDPTPFDRQIIMADGFDPDNQRTINAIVVGDVYKNLVSPTPLSENYSIATPLSSGYDICFVDFSNGTDDVRNSAKAMLKLIEYGCSQAGGNPVVVGGFSQGGLVSRLALLYGQKKVNGVYSANIGNVNKFISVDVPQKGAAIPVSLQNTLRKSEEANKNTYTYDHSFVVPAAMQMLFESRECFASTENPTGKLSFEHDKFYNFIDKVNPNGPYPQNMKLYSLSIGCWGVPYPSAPISAEALKVRILFSWYYVNLYENELSPGSYYDYFKVGGDANVPGDGPVNSFPYSYLPLLFGINAVIPLGDVARDAPTASIDNDNSRYKPTFIPVWSAFGLSADTYRSYFNNSDMERLTGSMLSPFHKIDITNSRLAHIYFSPEVVGRLVGFLMDNGVTTRTINPIVAFKAVANCKFVTAENGGDAALIANRTTAGLWEKFVLTNLGNGYYTLRAIADNKYVTAENSGATPLIANRYYPSVWESFNIVNNGDGTVSLLALANNAFVCADNGGNNPLIANRTTIGPWEKFTMIPQ